MNKLKQKEKENSLNEIRILASINHMNIIGYKDAFYDQEIFALCIVTEYADDGDLEKKINENKKIRCFFSETQIFTIFIQILNGLKSLHDQKIMHRDIKAANMLLFKDGFVKIGDMNVSKVMKVGLINTQTGTPYYASPEVWNNKLYDYKSDIWSLGCLLYEMTSLKAPFRGTTMKNLFDKVMKGTYDPIPAHYSKHLSEIIKSMLMLNPQLRPDCDGILRMICRKMSNLCINLPIEYEINTNGQNYYKIIKAEINSNKNYEEVKHGNVKPLNNNCNAINNNYQNNKSNGENKNNFNLIKIEPKNKKELLDTIKIPKQLHDINNILPKNNYRRNISTSANYESNLMKYDNDISLPNILNRSINERQNLNLTKDENINDIHIKNEGSKILQEVRINKRPISSNNKIDNRKLGNNLFCNINSNNHMNLFNQRNVLRNNQDNSGLNGRRLPTHHLKSLVDSRNPIIVNQISSKIEKINIVNCDVDLLQKLANLNGYNHVRDDKDNIILKNLNSYKQKNEFDISFNDFENNNISNNNLNLNKEQDNNNKETNNFVSSLETKQNPSTNLSNFYMRKNIDKITNLKIDINKNTAEKGTIPSDHNILARKLISIQSLDKDKLIEPSGNNSSERVNDNNNNNNNYKEKLNILNNNDITSLEKLRTRKNISKKFDLASLEDIQQTIKKGQKELNDILDRNTSLNENTKHISQSTKNKNRNILFLNRDFIYSIPPEKIELLNNNQLANDNPDSNPLIIKAEDSYHNKNQIETENKSKEIHLKLLRDSSSNLPDKNTNRDEYGNQNETNKPNHSKFNNIKFDLEKREICNDEYKNSRPINNNSNLNENESLNNCNTDLEHKTTIPSAEKEIEENIISSKLIH